MKEMMEEGNVGEAQGARELLDKAIKAIEAGMEDPGGITPESLAEVLELLTQVSNLLPAGEEAVDGMSSERFERHIGDIKKKGF